MTFRIANLMNFSWINKANKSCVTEPMSKNKYQIFSCGLTFTKAAIISLRGHSAQEPTTTKEITYHLLITINSPKGEGCLYPRLWAIRRVFSAFSFLVVFWWTIRSPTQAGYPLRQVSNTSVFGLSLLLSLILFAFFSFLSHFPFNHSSQRCSAE